MNQRLAAAPTTGVNAPPVSCTAKGTQYIAMAAGGNTQLDYKHGNQLIVYKLGWR